MHLDLPCSVSRCLDVRRRTLGARACLRARQCYGCAVRRTATVLCLAACGGGDPSPIVDAAPCMDTGHDEDGDGIGDDCDICPAAPDPAQRDTTEAATMLAFPDGIGDVCDPRGALSGDKLGALHTFADPAQSERWDGSGWTIDSDRARAVGDARWTAKRGERGDGLYVQARIAELAWQATGVFEVSVDGGGVESGLVCAIAKDRDGDGSDELDSREVGGATMTKSAGAIAGAITLSTWRTIDFNGNGALHCRLTFEGGSAMLEMPTSAGVAIGSYGFSSHAATTDVTSIVVYTSPTLPVQND